MSRRGTRARPARRPGRAPRAAAVTGVAIAVTLAACAQDTHEATWDDLVTARQQDAIDRGWVPDWLPESATDLAEVDRPATGEVVLRATVPADAELDVCSPPGSAPDSPTDSPTVTGTPPDVADLAEWWDPPPDQDVLACPGGWWMVRSDGTLWAWTNGAPATSPSPTDATASTAGSATSAARRAG